MMLTSIEGIENLNTSEVTDMSDMFHNCSRLTSLNLSSFNTSKVTHMIAMFRYCPGLKSLDLTNEWGTLCLPFDVKYSRNDSYKLYSLTEATANALTFTEYEDANEIKAGTPMAIKRISETADNKVTITKNRGFIKTSLNNPTTESAWRLVGTYRTADVPDEGYVISQNAFWNVKGLKDEGQNIKRVRVNGYRAYIMPPTTASDVPVGTAARMLSIEVPDDNTTAIDDSNAIDDINAVFGGEATYYDTNGRRIPSLRQGVNIVKIGNRTKKVIIK